MFDIFHNWGADLAVGNGGDLALSSAGAVTDQRVRRRLLTNPGDYLWHLEYGGGLAQFVGTTASPTKIEAVIRTQLALESSVATTPTPNVSAAIADTANGYFVANISYVDQLSAQPSQLSLTVA